MKRGGSLRRTGRATEYAAEVREDRLAWAAEQESLCMWCGADSWRGLEIHEIERKSHAAGRWGQRCNYLLLCGACHAGPVASAPHAQQLACKLLCDPEHFDLGAWLRIADVELRAPERVTLRDVVRYLRIDETVFG